MPDGAAAPLSARLSYAQCWEDVGVLQRALRVGPGDHVLSIASAGDNSIALALSGARVTALDLSLPQLALTELKLACAGLTYRDFHALMGLAPHPDRLAIYRLVRDDLSPAARAFLDARPALIRGGVLHQGRFERYLEVFRRRVLPLVHRRRAVLGWFDLPDVEAQRRYYRDVWDGPRWRGLFRVFFSRRIMAAMGRSPEHFAHARGPVGRVFLGRAERVLTELPLSDNGYVQWMLAGRYLTGDALPPYLTPAGHAALSDAAGRIRLVHAPLDAHLASTRERYSGFNLSNVFEYLPRDVTSDLLGAVVDAARPGARVAYWNLLVPRSRPASLAERLVPDRERARALLAQDRAFVYGDFHVETVVGAPMGVS